MVGADFYRLFLGFFIGFLLINQANAQNNNEISSAYTKLDLDECLLLYADDIVAEWACPGYKGYPLYVAEGDLRFFVSYGFFALDEKAASQTLPAFNYINDIIEWRLKKINGDFMPFATILRWKTESGEYGEVKSEILVVTKLEQNNTCHIAYINAKMVPNANELAREIADNKAENFNCETDEIYKIAEK